MNRAFGAKHVPERDVNNGATSATILASRSEIAIRLQYSCPAVAKPTAWGLPPLC